MWRIVWVLMIERRDSGDDARRWPTLLRWAIVGLAVLGATAVLVARHIAT